VPLHPPTQRRERILIIGFSGGGKSTCWLNVARWLAKTRSDSKMWVVDTDRTWEAMRPLDGSLDKTVVAYDVEDYPGMKKAVNDIRDVASNEDFLVYDMIDTLWTESQNYFFEEAFAKDFEEFLVNARRTGDTIGGEYGVNWNAINKLYAGVNDRVRRFPGHVIACTPGEVVREAGKSGKGGEQDPQIVREFGRYKVKPAGQKKLRHDYHSILLCQDTPGGYTLSTLKERNPPGSVEGDGQHRVSLESVKTGEFTMTYLVKVAGWKLA